MLRTPLRASALAGLGLVAAFGPASAFQVEVTVENLLDSPGFAVTPVYFGFHDGSVDLFDVGANASPGVEALAELGAVGGLAAERLAMQPDSVGGVVGSPSGPPPIEFGESATGVFDLDPDRHFRLAYLSMVIPSNDTFLGNDDPLEFLLFDSGEFVGDVEIIVTQDSIYDAGTEDNLPGVGPAFVDGIDATLGSELGNGPIAAADLGALFADFDGVTNAAGVTVVSPTLGDGGSIAFARITISAVESASAVPVPAALPLLGAAVAGLALMRRRRR